MGLIIVAVICCAASACGDKKDAAQTRPIDMRREVMKTLVAAAAADDAKMAWPLLSTPSQRREGSLAAFRKDTWPTLRSQLAPFAGGALPVQISENIDDRFGLIALSRGKHAFATAMRRTGPTWLMEIP